MPRCSASASASGIPPATFPENSARSSGKKGYAAAAEKFTTRFPCVVTLAEFPPAGRRLVVRSHLDRVTRAFNETAGVLFDRYAGNGGSGHGPPLLSPLVTRLAWYVLTCRMEEVLSSPESTAEDLHRLAAAFSHWGIPRYSRRCITPVIGTLHHPADGRLGV